MKKYFNKHKYISSIYILLSVFIINIVQSCTKKKITLKAAKDDIIEVIYYKNDSIDLEVKGIYEKAYIKKGIFINIDNDFYYSEKKGSKSLMFSTKKDTVFEEENENELNYLYEIKKVSNNSFKTTCIYVNDYGEKHIFQMIYYDKDYKIFKIVRNGKNYE